MTSGLFPFTGLFTATEYPYRPATQAWPRTAISAVNHCLALNPISALQALRLDGLRLAGGVAGMVCGEAVAKQNDHGS